MSGSDSEVIPHQQKERTQATAYLQVLAVNMKGPLNRPANTNYVFCDLSGDHLIKDSYQRSEQNPGINVLVVLLKWELLPFLLPAVSSLGC